MTGDVARIPSGARVLLDTPAFVYHAEAGSRYYSAADEIFARVRSGDLLAFASTLVLTELLVPYFRARDSARARTMASTLHDFPNLRIQPVSPRVAVRAAELRAGHHLHTPDAVHVATALESGAEWLITNDLRLRRVETDGMRVWLFDEATSSDSGWT